MSEYRLRLNEYLIDLREKDLMKYEEMKNEIKFLVETFGIESTVMQLEELGEDI